MKRVLTLTGGYGTFVSRDSANRTTRFERSATNAAITFFGVPHPVGHEFDFINLYEVLRTTGHEKLSSFRLRKKKYIYIYTYKSSFMSNAIHRIFEQSVFVIIFHLKIKKESSTYN